MSSSGKAMAGPISIDISSSEESDDAHAVQTKSCHFVLIHAGDFTVHSGYVKLANLFRQLAKLNEHISGEHHEAEEVGFQLPEVYVIREEVASAR